MRRPGKAPYRSGRRFYFQGVGLLYNRLQKPGIPEARKRGKRRNFVFLVQFLFFKGLFILQQVKAVSD